MRFTHQELHGLGDAQQNFEQLEAMNLLQVLSAQPLQLAFGTSTIPWPGGSQNSSSKVINHGIGRTPKAVFVSSGLVADGFSTRFVITAWSGNWGASTFQCEAWAPTSPAVGVTGDFSWAALG